MTDTSVADDRVRSDFLAGQGGAADAQLEAWRKGMIAQAQGAPKPAIAAVPGQPEAASVAPAEVTNMLPIGKRVLTAVGNFAYGLVRPFVEGPSIGEQLAGEAAAVQQKEQELGRPLSLRERLDIGRDLGTSIGLGFAGGGGLGRSIEAIKAKPLEGIAGEPPGGVAGIVESAAPPQPTAVEAPAPVGETPAAEAPEATPPARDVLRLGDPLEPAVTVRPTPREAAQAEVTLGRMEVEGEPPPPAGWESAGYADTRTGEPMETPQAAPIVKGELPIVRFRQDAEQIDERLPPVDEGLTRLWRGNRPDEVGAARQFTNDLPGIALPFREVYGGDISYVDVPTADLEKYENKAGAAPGAEFSLPPELAREARATGWARPAMPEPIRMSDETIHDYLAGARVDNPVNVNLARIGSGEDIADALEQVSKTIPEQAVQSNLATKAAADALGLSPEDFLAGYKGEQLNASQTTAMRFMLDSSARQLIDYAKAAREPGATPEAQGQFLKAFSVHRSLQQYFENARAEAGRTLQSWSIMSEQRAAYGRAVDELISRVDDKGDLSQLADQVADMDDPLKVSRLVAGAVQSTGRDRLLTWMYNARLSSPTTVVKKLTSDVGMAMWNTATRYAAEKLGTGAVAPGETGALIQGYIGSFGDAIRAGGQALKAGESQFWKDYGTMDAIDMPQYGNQLEQLNRRFRLSALANGADPSIPVDQPTRGMFSYVRSALPTSWIGAADDFAKVWQYRANLRALAVRAADGDPDKFAQLLDAPPRGLHAQALNDALKYTFQEPLTGMASSLRDVVDAVNIPMPQGWDIPVGRTIMPFVKVPVNIARMAYRSSPLAYALPSPAVRAIMAGGGAERDILMAQMGLGTALSLGVGGLVLNGNITGKGPSDAGLRREWTAAGNRPYSLQLPGARPVQLNQIEPFGMTLGAIADTYNLFKFAKDEDNERLGLSLAFGVGQALLSKTYMQGASDFLDAVAHPDQDAEQYTSRLIAGLAVPQIGQRAGEAMDQWQRAHYGILDGIEANLPIVREGLPPARTLWGDPVPTREAYAPFMSGHAAEAVSPIGLGPDPATAQPIDRWIWDNRAAFPREEQTQRGIAKPSRTQSYSAGKLSAQVELTPTEYDRFQVLAGNGLKDPRTGLGAKDTLNAFVTGNHPDGGQQQQWDGASPAERALIVQTVVNKYRNAAKQQLRQDMPEIETALQAGWQARAAALKGAGAIQ